MYLLILLVFLLADLKKKKHLILKDIFSVAHKLLLKSGILLLLFLPSSSSAFSFVFWVISPQSIHFWIMRLNVFSSRCIVCCVFIWFQISSCSEIEETLLVLPFDYATKMLSILEVFLLNKWQPELTVRCICFLLR